jgi:hypothetical protein
MSATDDNFIGPPPRAVRGLSWGALLFTGPWLLRNGFWLTAILHVICAIFVWPMALVIAVLFFFLGAKWSWDSGRRWRSYDEFCNSRFNWNFLALVAVIVVILITTLELLAAWLGTHLR